MRVLSVPRGRLPYHWRDGGPDAHATRGEALTLRRRLTFLVALAVIVPITVMGVTVTNLLSGEIAQRGRDRLLLASALASQTLVGEGESVGATVAGLAGLPQMGAAVRGAGDLAATLQAGVGSPDLDVIVVVDAAGAVVAEAREPGSFAAGVEAPTAEQLAGDAAAGLALIGRAPIAGTDATLVGGRWLDRTRLDQVPREERAELAVVLGDQVLAATTPGAATAARQAAEPGQHRSVSSQGQRVLVDSSDLAGARLVAVVVPPGGTSSKQLFLLLGALVVVMLVLVVLVGYVVSGLVTEPVQAVVDAANAVALGDLNQRVEVKGDREVAALGQAFNEMTDNLRDHVHRLEESRTQFREAMARLGDVLVSTHDLDGIVEVVLEACLLTTSAELAVFYKRVAMPARIKASDAVGGELSLELNGVGVAGSAARKLAPAVFPGTDTLDATEPAVDGAIAVPVSSDGRLFGVIAVYGRTGGGAFQAEAVDTLQTLARQAEVAIGNVVLHDEARRQARTDGLTSLWNKREFELRCREAAREADRFKDAFAVVIVDVDDFKVVNDRWDHTTGDAALIWVSSRIDDATREVDIVARWGGEEFAVLLPRASLNDARVVSERIRSSVAAEPFVYGAINIPLTVSVGYGAYPQHGTTSLELFRAADAALLRAKRAGKNRIQQAGIEEVA